MSRDQRSPILLGESGARVDRVRNAEGGSWIEKFGPAPDIAQEAAVLRWCAGRLPVAKVLQQQSGCLQMSDLPGRPLTELSLDLACSVLAEALFQIHAVPVGDCPFCADWGRRLREAEDRFQAGLVDESDFGDENQGRTASNVLRELQVSPPLPGLRCFTHGDATLENFLACDGKLSGIVDMGRAGITHPAQDWALALRSVASYFGPEAECLLRQYLPAESADELLLRRFRLLDEMF